MDNNEYEVVELNARLGKIKLSRNLKLLAVGALCLAGTGNFIVVSNASIEEALVESGALFVGAVGFAIGAIKKNKEGKVLQKQINKLHNK